MDSDMESAQRVLMAAPRKLVLSKESENSGNTKAVGASFTISGESIAN
jgi:hypothetical protein